METKGAVNLFASWAIISPWVLGGGTQESPQPFFKDATTCLRSDAPCGILRVWVDQLAQEGQLIYQGHA
ncbi:SPW repeat protein [Streptomyces canus]|uniref:SPW repeat domain-containing protein n=1 Tax=Streptomyces canus TaxID=58343 RepID=UPI003864EC35